MKLAADLWNAPPTAALILFGCSLCRPVAAFQVDHKNPPFAVGYRITTPDRAIVLSGDTRPVDAVAEACNGCDILLYHQGYRGETDAALIGRISATFKGRIESARDLAVY